MSKVVESDIGKTFGRLTVVAQAAPKIYGKKRRRVVSCFECVCSCGNSCVVTMRSLRTGDTKSCGCLRRDYLRSEKNLEWRRGLFAGEKNPFYGRKHTQETRARMSKNHADFSGDKNPFKNSLRDPQKRVAYKKRCKDLWVNRDAEWRNLFRAKLSKVNAERVKDKPKGCHFHGWLPATKCVEGGHYYRSSWELLFSDYLEKCEVVSSFLYENIVFPYEDSSGVLHHGRNDFHIRFITGEELVVEIKPKSLISRCLIKLLGNQEYCLLNNLQFLIISSGLIFKPEKIMYLLGLASKGAFHVGTYLSSTVRIPSDIIEIDGQRWIW